MNHLNICSLIVKHLFFDCSLAKAAWFRYGFLPLMTWDGTIPLSIWFPQVHEDLIRNQVMLGHGWQLLMVVFWQIWLTRNEARFQGIYHQLSKKIHQIDAIIWNMSQHPNSPSLVRFRPTIQRMNLIINVKWWPPPLGWIKMNMDGAFLQRVLVAGSGAVLRDDAGQFCGVVSMPICSGSVLLAEVWATKLGLVLARMS